MSMALAGCLEEPTNVQSAEVQAWYGLVAHGTLQAASPYGEGAITVHVPSAGEVVLRQIDSNNFQWIGELKIELVAPDGTAAVLMDAVGAAGALGNQAITGQTCNACEVSLVGDAGQWTIRYATDGAFVMGFELETRPVGASV